MKSTRITKHLIHQDAPAAASSPRRPEDCFVELDPLHGLAAAQMQKDGTNSRFAEQPRRTSPDEILSFVSTDDSPQPMNAPPYPAAAS